VGDDGTALNAVLLHRINAKKTSDIVDATRFGVGGKDNNGDGNI